MIANQVPADHQSSLRQLVERARPARPFGLWLLAQSGRQDQVGELARWYAGCACPLCTGRTSRRYSPAGVTAELDAHHAQASLYGTLAAAVAEWRQSTGRAASTSNLAHVHKIHDGHADMA